MDIYTFLTRTQANISPNINSSNTLKTSNVKETGTLSNKTRELCHPAACITFCSSGIV